MESSDKKCLCRVCGEIGHYDLSEMKFRCNDTDVLLIEAYNAFSELNNVSTSFLIAFNLMKNSKKSHFFCLLRNCSGICGNLFV